MTHFDTKSPECGWQPFIDWLTEQGVDPADCRSLDVDPATMTATAHCFKRLAGRKQVKNGEMVMQEPKTVTITSLPPRRFHEGGIIPGGQPVVLDSRDFPLRTAEPGEPSPGGIE